MKAIVYDKYGSPEVLQLKDVAKPVQTDNDILVRTYATSVTKYDCWQRSRIHDRQSHSTVICQQLSFICSLFFVR